MASDIDASQVQWDTPIDSSKVQWDDAPAAFTPKAAPPWLVQADKPLQGAGTGLMQVGAHVMDIPGKAVTNYAVNHGVTNPYAAAALGTIPDLAEDAIMGGPKAAAGRNVGKAATDWVGAHPLAGAANEEQTRLATIVSKANASGLDVSKSIVAPAQESANAMVRDDLKLPYGAPLTPKMFDAARKQYASPAYEAVRALPGKIPLSDATEATLQDVRPFAGTRIDLPEGSDITGQQAVDLTKKLRNRANQLDGIQGVNANGDLWSDVAKAHLDAANAIENDVKTHLESIGNGGLADDWHDARVYTAKSYAYQHALDGAGNVRVPDLKRQLLNGEPLSDNAEVLATVGAQNPELFRSTPAQSKPGIIRRAAARTVPVLGGIAGSHLGPFGTALGVEAGQGIADRLLSPPR